MNAENWTPTATTTALALAKAFGHGWAAYAVLREDGSLDHEATEEAQREGEADRISGLRPSLTHSTKTGRLRWEVAPDGACRLVVTRPLTAITSLAEGLDGHVVVAVATLHRLVTGAQIQRVHWGRPDNWGRLEHGVAAPAAAIGEWLVAVDYVPELFEARHEEALSDGIFAVLGGRHEIVPTRTATVLRGSTWCDAAFVEIDEHEFWLRDLPVEPVLSCPSVQGEAQA